MCAKTQHSRPVFRHSPERTTGNARDFARAGGGGVRPGGVENRRAAKEASGSSPVQGGPERRRLAASGAVKVGSIASGSVKLNHGLYGWLDR
jgi:hypothetical protein